MVSQLAILYVGLLAQLTWYVVLFADPGLKSHGMRSIITGFVAPKTPFPGFISITLCADPIDWLSRPTRGVIDRQAAIHAHCTCTAPYYFCFVVLTTADQLVSNKPKQTISMLRL